MHIYRICTSIHIHKHPSIEMHLFVMQTYLCVCTRLWPLTSTSLESLARCRQDRGEKKGPSLKV